MPYNNHFTYSRQAYLSTSFPLKVHISTYHWSTTCYSTLCVDDIMMIATEYPMII